MVHFPPPVQLQAEVEAHLQASVQLSILRESFLARRAPATLLLPGHEVPLCLYHLTGSHAGLKSRLNLGPIVSFRGLVPRKEAVSRVSEILRA